MNRSVQKSHNEWFLRGILNQVNRFIASTSKNSKIPISLIAFSEKTKIKICLFNDGNFYSILQYVNQCWEWELKVNENINERIYSRLCFSTEFDEFYLFNR
jgi:hypothetical protein